MPLFNIVLNKDNDDGGGPTTDACCPFSFGSIMGQEDLFRETATGSETRVSNSLQARIVWATSVDATSRVYYGVDPLLDQDTGIVASGNTYHEVFIPNLNLDTLYRFKVESTSTVCDAGGETLTSEVYWFMIGGELNIETGQLDFNITTGIVTQVTNTTTNNTMDATADLASTEPVTRDPLDTSVATSILTIGSTPSETIDNTMILTTTPSTTVV